MSSRRRATSLALLLAIVGVPSSRAEPSPVAEPCPEGTTWHEGDDPGAYPIQGRIPARVGWCEREGGVRHGPMRWWWPSGALMRQVTFEDGAETGPISSAFEDGRPESAARQVDGRLEGRYTAWWPSGGKARSLTYTEGRPHGWATYWGEGGRVAMRGAWENGRKEGTWESYHANGLLKEVARWQEGRLSGRQLTFNEGGVFVTGTCWEAGEKRWESKNEAESRTRRCQPW